MDYRSLQKLYEEEFDPKEYIAIVVQETSTLLAFIEDKLHDVIEEMKFSPGKKLIDVGCGPTFCNVLAATKKFDDVVLCDLTERNRHEVEKMVRGFPDAADVSRNAQLQALREGHDDLEKGAEEIIRRTRKAIKKVVPCNVLDPRVLPEEHWETFDVVISSLCLEAATCDAETYTRALKNIGSLVKPEGLIVLGGVIGGSGDTRSASGNKPFADIGTKKSK